MNSAKREPKRSPGENNADAPERTPAGPTFGETDVFLINRGTAAGAHEASTMQALCQERRSDVDEGRAGPESVPALADVDHGASSSLVLAPAEMPDAEGAPDQTAPAQMPQGPPPLPTGWVEKVSRSTGQVYYFNAGLQSSTYERPMPEEKEKDSPRSNHTHASVKTTGTLVSTFNL